MRKDSPLWGYLSPLASIDGLSISNVLESSSSSVIVKVAVSSEKVELVAFVRVMVAVLLVSSLSKLIKLIARCRHMVGVC